MVRDQEGLTWRRSFKSFRQSPYVEKGRSRIYAGLLLNTGILMEIYLLRMIHVQKKKSSFLL